MIMYVYILFIIFYTMMALEYCNLYTCNIMTGQHFDIGTNILLLIIMFGNGD